MTKTHCRAAVRHALVSAVAAALTTSVASAQGASPTGRIAGPFSGLFGGRRADNHHTIDLRASLFGVQQTVNVPADIDPALLDPRFQRTASFAGVQSTLLYSFSRRTANGGLTANAGALVSDFSVAPEAPQYAGFGGIGLTTRLTRRISFIAGGQTFYGSAFSLGNGQSGLSALGGGLNTPGGVSGPAGGLPSVGTLSPGALDPNALTSSVGVPSINVRSVGLAGSIGVTSALTRKATLAVDAQAQQTIFPGFSGNNATTVSSGAVLNYQVWRRLSLFAGYRRSQIVLSDAAAAGPAPAAQWLDFGVNYGDGLTLRLGRRTTLTTNVGLGSGRGLTGRTRFTALGNVALTHSIGRTWSTGASFSRILGYQAGFLQQVGLQDIASTFIGGQLARRVSVSAAASYMRGYLDLDMSDYNDNYGASAGLSMALHRRVSLFTQFGYNGSRVPAGFSALPFLPTFSRRVAVVGLTVWSPLYSNPRVRQ